MNSWGIRFLLFLFTPILAFAQLNETLEIEKNNTFRLRIINLPKIVTVTYCRGDSIFKVKGNLVKYKDFHLYIKQVNDTGAFLIHRDEVVRFSYTNHHGLFLLPLMLGNTMMIISPYFAHQVNPYDMPFLVAVMASAASGYLLYSQLNIWKPSLRMDKKWSFR